MRLIIVAGARPNFVKIAPLVPALRAVGHIAEVAHTGQHYDDAMSDTFFRELDIPEPRWFLGVGSGSHAVQTGRAMVALEELFASERPDGVVVVGDVNSTLAAALAATKLHVPVVHLEAGLRSFDMSMPEEVNRLVTDQLSSLCLAPTRSACANLQAEGIDARHVHLVGNIMTETLLRSLDRLADLRPAEKLGLERQAYALATIHRPENTDEPLHLSAIMAALSQLDVPVLFPAHPRTRALLESAQFDRSQVRMLDPVGYLDMLALQRDASIVVTDSGGVQEEACMLGTPCVTVRKNTERDVTIELGANTLVAADSESILRACQTARRSSRDWSPPEFWDDQVSARVCAAIEDGIPALRGFA